MPTLDRRSLPMRLWRQAKRQVWNPDDIDFSDDRQQWDVLAPSRREGIRRVCALFVLGERAVTRDLLPLLVVVSAERRQEEATYLTSFLWEEAKHHDLFDRFVNDVAGEAGDLSGYVHESYRRILEEELPRSLLRLREDPSPPAQAEAAVTYNLIVEGVMAESGYYVIERLLGGCGQLPGLQRAVRLIARDEARHVAFGVYFLIRLIIEHGDPTYKAVLRRLHELKPLVEKSTLELVGMLSGDPSIEIEAPDLIRDSQERFARRLRRIMNARAHAGRETALAVTT